MGAGAGAGYPGYMVAFIFEESAHMLHGIFPKFFGLFGGTVNPA